MKITMGIRELIFRNESSVAIRNKAIEEGMTTLYQDGLNKVIQGVTSLEEVFRIAKKTQQDEEAEDSEKVAS